MHNISYETWFNSYKTHVNRDISLISEFTTTKLLLLLSLLSIRLWALTFGLASLALFDRFGFTSFLAYVRFMLNMGQPTTLLGLGSKEFETRLWNYIEFCCCYYYCWPF